MTPSRERAIAVALCVVGAGLMLLAGGQSWFGGRAAVDGLPSIPIRLTGRDVAGVVSAVGLLALAAAGVVLLIGGTARRVVGVIVAVAAVAATARVVDVLVIHRDEAVSAALATSVGGSAVDAATTASAWPWIALVGALLVATGGVLLAARGGRWPVRSRRYETPTPASAPDPASDEDRSDAMWKALDRGEDPTDGPSRA